MYAAMFFQRGQGESQGVVFRTLTTMSLTILLLIEERAKECTGLSDNGNESQHQSTKTAAMAPFSLSLSHLAKCPRPPTPTIHSKSEVVVVGPPLLLEETSNPVLARASGRRSAALEQCSINVTPVSLQDDTTNV